jgi:predicted nucleic acid-binding protein
MVNSHLHVLTKSEILPRQVFLKYDDKQWSFADCTSKVVIEKLHLAAALSFDHHFKQFGTVAVVP